MRQQSLLGYREHVQLEVANFRDDRQTHEGEGDQGLHVLWYIHFIRFDSQTTDLFVNVAVAFVGDNAHDQQLQRVVDLTVFDDGLATMSTIILLLGVDDVHVFVADGDNAIAVMGYGQCNRTVTQTIDDHRADADLAGIVVLIK